MGAGSETLILGGGTGGIAAARVLRDLLPPEHAVRIVSASPSFQMGATKTWVMLGEAQPDEVRRPLDDLKRHGIDVILSEVRRIDPGRRAIVADGGELRADYLIIALGARPDMGLVPGLEESAETFYTAEGAVRARGSLSAFRGGKILILVTKAPFPCPPGPYEAAMSVESWCRARGVRDRSTIEVRTVEKAPMPTAGPAIGAFVVERLAERGIGFHPGTDVKSVDGARRVVVLADGTEVPYDVLLAIPPHVAPAAVRASGLANPAGWIPVDPASLELAGTASPGRVFAIGDVTSVPLPGRFAPDLPLSLPKAGVFAEAHGTVAARRIAAHVLGRESADRFDGKGFCFIELGGGLALRADGSFFALPHPAMTPSEASPSRLAEKRAWVEAWVRTYLR